MPHAAGHCSLLVLLNPGRTSRNYLLGIARAAERFGILAGTIELGDMWAALHAARSPGDRAGVQREWASRVQDICAARRVTHALGYVFNGAFDFGLAPDAQGRPAGLFPRLGVRHVMLWTDHPNWAMNAAALDPSVRRALAHPDHRHLLKSPAAADECAAVCAWPAQTVIGTDMGEDPTTLRPAREVAPVHDAVLIMSDAAPPAPEVHGFLHQDDPDPRAIMCAMRPVAERQWRRACERHGADPRQIPGLEALGAEWLALKLDDPAASFWSLHGALAAAHAEALSWLKADPRRWYDAVAALNAITAWRRTFWPAWLARRINLGVYGCTPAAAQAIGARQQPELAGWIAYERQAHVYALGHAALNINAPHDEEGLTHKPFQMAASGAAVIHHDSRGIERCFLPGEEMLTFTRGPVLLDHVSQLRADARLRRAMGDRARARVERSHSWDARLRAWIADTPDQAASSAAQEAAPVVAAA